MRGFSMRTRVKFLLSSLLLMLALLLTGFTATGTIQAYETLQQTQQQVKHSDVRAVRGWMTIPYVSHVYRVPQPCFTQELHVNDRWLLSHANLRMLADSYHRPLVQV